MAYIISNYNACNTEINFVYPKEGHKKWYSGHTFTHVYNNYINYDIAISGIKI